MHKKGPWTKEEDEILKRAQKAIGNKWAAIKKLYLTNRSDNSIVRALTFKKKKMQFFVLFFCVSSLLVSH